MAESVNHKIDRITLWFSKNTELIAVKILSLWLLLPIGMCIYDLFMNASGQFPTDTYLIAAGTPVGYINYNIVITTYYRVFLCIGIPTLLFALFAVLLCRNRVFNRGTMRKMPWFYLLLALLIWSIISTFQAKDLSYAFLGYFYGHDGLSSYFIYAAVFLCASMIRVEKHRLNILRLYCIMVCYLALLMIVQELTRNSFLDHSFPSFKAVVFNQFNHFGYILCMGILASVGLYLYDGGAGRGLRGLYLAGTGFLTYALLLNDTFGAWVATAVALPLVYVFYYRSGRRVDGGALLPGLMFLAVCVLNCLGLTFGAPSLFANLSLFSTDIVNITTGAEDAAFAGTGRFTLWKDTLVRIGQRPIFGFGPEGFWGANAITNNDSTHNEYLRIAGFLGIPALLMYLGALITLARHHWKHIRTLSPMVLAVSGVTLVYLCSACFGNPLFNTYPYFWMFLGLTTADGHSAPLLAPELAGIGNQLAQRPKKKRLIAILAVGAALAVGLGFAYNHLARSTEDSLEIADIQCMRGAELTAQTLVKAGKARPGDGYWYDAVNLSLAPDSQPMPAPYGLGTPRRGLHDINRDDARRMGYAYDGDADYRSKVIHVTFTDNPSGDGDPGIELSWVEWAAPESGVTGDGSR